MCITHIQRVHTPRTQSVYTGLEVTTPQSDLVYWHEFRASLADKSSLLSRVSCATIARVKTVTECDCALHSTYRYSASKCGRNEGSLKFTNIS